MWRIAERHTVSERKECHRVPSQADALGSLSWLHAARLHLAAPPGTELALRNSLIPHNSAGVSNRASKNCHRPTNRRTKPIISAQQLLRTTFVSQRTLHSAIARSRNLASPQSTDSEALYSITERSTAVSSLITRAFLGNTSLRTACLLKAHSHVMPAAAWTNCASCAWTHGLTA